MIKKTTVVILLALMSSSVSGFTPTAAQIEQFQKLPRAQQEQLARQFGVDISVLDMGSSSELTPKKEIPPPQKVEGERTENSERMVSNQKVRNDDTLKPFGYEIFSGEPLEFTVIDDMPVPLDYTIAPGDELQVKMYGKTSQESSVIVNREGYVHLPDLAPIAVSGQTFAQMRQSLTKALQTQVMGVEVVVSMGAMRTMQVFVVGDVKQPGAYNVNALTSLTQALIASGGVKESGSLRNIQLKRKGKVVSRFDLYDLLLKGDSSKDIRLLSGDTLFVPSKNNTVTVDGEIVRPAIYELRGKTTLAQMLDVAGGVKPQAYLSKIGVKRSTRSSTTQYTLDLATAKGRNFAVKNGDEITLLPSTKTLENVVAVRGEVVRQGAYRFTPGMRVSDVIESVEYDLKQSADLKYALVVREINANRDISVIQFNLLNAIQQPRSKDDLLLAERDQIFIFDNGVNVDYWFGDYVNGDSTRMHSKRKPSSNQKHRAQSNPKANQKKQVNQSQPQTQNRVTSTQQGYVDIETGAMIDASKQDQFKQVNHSDKSIASEIRHSSRQTLLEPILERLKEQSTYESPAKLVTVTGAVKFPGVYPLGVGADISDVVRAAGGLKEEAFLKQAEITRRTTNGIDFSVSYLPVGLRAALSGESMVEIQPQDHLVIKSQPNWQQDMIIELQGEVMFPGVYTFQRGDTLKDIIERAGGFTQFAYPEGAIFSRERLKRQEQERLALLNRQLKQEISSLALRRQSSSATYTTSPVDALKIAEELASAEAVGRLVISLSAAMQGEHSSNLMLEKGDKLYVPPTNPTIGVMGEVQYASNHTFKPSMSIEDYINNAGGTKKQADTDRIYIVRADGSVVLPNNSFWFSRKSKPLAPGDTIIVPIDTDYLDGLSTMTSATQILYQMGVAWSAIQN